MRATQQIRDIIDRLAILESELGEAPMDMQPMGAAGQDDAEERNKTQKAISRMYSLAQNGLVDKGQVSALNTAMKALMAGNPLSSPQRMVMLDVMSTLMDLIGDDSSLVARIKQDLKKQQSPAA